MTEIFLRMGFDLSAELEVTLTEGFYRAVLTDGEAKRERPE